ncbi:MAG: AAA family ATPase [Sedimentisphaerales bacterium]|nr:AAA family ATPase [Sedimentisphaerales bacterium]
MAEKKVTNKRIARKKTVPQKTSYPPAYFLSLSVENVRCFGPKQTIDVSDGHGRPAQWTLILGDNNTGKTTLLQCFVALEPYKISNDKERLDPKLFKETTFNFYRGIETNYFNINGKVCYGSKIRELYKEFKSLNQEIYISDFLSMHNTYPKQHFTGLICYGYGASRIMGKSTLSEKELSDPTSSLFRDDVELINAEEWLLQADYSAKASSKSSKVGQTVRKKRDQIKEILINLLPEVDDIRVTEPTQKNLKPRVEFKTPYGWIGLNGLSLGYRAMISWMVDLANRMFERYPKSVNPLAEPAIVLIDEIDLHLHPKWQRTIMNFLSERFINTQFIVTAHSPLVVQAAANANIVLLKREGDHVVIDNNPQSVLGWRTDQILTGLFELPSRSFEIEELQKKRRELLSKARLTKTDKKKLKDIESKMGTLPTAETPEDIEAMEIIRQAAKRLKNGEKNNK